MVAYLLRDLVGQLGAAVVHGEQDRGDLQATVQVRLDQLDVVEQLAQPFQRVVLALDRDEHLVAGDERVDREQAERRRAVDEDVVDLPAVRGDGPAQPVLAGDDRDELDLGAGEVDGGRHGPQIRRLLDRHRNLLQRRPVDQHLVDRRRPAGVLDAEPGAGVALRVEVDHQHPQAVHGHRDGEVDRAGGLADAAFLVRDGDHPPARGLGERVVAAGVPDPNGLGRLPHDRRVEAVAVVRGHTDRVVEHAPDPGPAGVELGHVLILAAVAVLRVRLAAVRGTEPPGRPALGAGRAEPADRARSAVDGQHVQGPPDRPADG